MREIGIRPYDSATYNDENTLLNFKLMNAPLINTSFTYLWGNDSNLFPLLSMTEGQMNFSNKVPINGADSQYRWKIAGRMRFTSQVKRLISTALNGRVGMNGSPIEVEMVDNWFPYQYGAIGPDGKSLIRVQTEGRPTSRNTFIYTFASQSSTGIDAKQFASGLFWSMQAPIIPFSKSDGTRSNRQGFNEATNQFSAHRFSENIAGNITNKVLEFELDVQDANGNIRKTKSWIPHIMKQWELTRKQVLEEDLWYSRYNRDVNGIISLKDPSNGEPIPRGAGVFECLESVGNDFSYSVFTPRLMDNIIARLNVNKIGHKASEKIIYCGKGFARKFSESIERDASLRGYLTPLGEKKIQDNGDFLSYGAYFNQYKMIDGTIITVRPVAMFDQGGIADAQRLNGMVVDGLPLNSYTGVCLDHSITGDGEGGETRNIQVVYEQGREFTFGIYKGMSDVPAEWGAVPQNIVSTTKDIASYEVICTQGFNMLNPNTSFSMKMFD